MTARQDRARKGKETATESWVVKARPYAEDQRSFEGTVDIVIDWDAFNHVVEHQIGAALRSAAQGKSGRNTWQHGIVKVSIKKGTGKFIGG